MTRFSHIPETFEATRRTQDIEFSNWLGVCTDRMLANTDAETLCRRLPKLAPRDVAQRLLAAQVRRSLR